MPTSDPTRSTALPPTSFTERLGRDLATIARVMDRARGFPAVSPGGWIAMGVVGLGLGPLANLVREPRPWLLAWLAIAALAATVGLAATFRRARAEDYALWSQPAATFWLQLATPLAVGALLTALWSARGSWELVAGTWLVFYGTGLTAGGSWCRNAVRRAGIALQVLGLAAFAWPALGGALLVAGFGGVHVVTGMTMWRRDGSESEASGA
jgi:hypothetical protein